MSAWLAACLLLQDAGVSLEAHDMPLAEAFARLARQSGEEFRVEPALKDARVTVAFREIPVLEAVERVSRSHGACRVVANMQGGPFVIAPGAASSAPASTEGPFHLRLTGARSLRSTDFQGARQAQLIVDVQLLWERRAAPAALRLNAVESLDDLGTSLARPAAATWIRTIGKRGQIQPGTLTLSSPSAGARRLSRMIVELETWSAGPSVPLTLDALDAGTAADFPGGRALLLRTQRNDHAWTGALEIRMAKIDDGAPLQPADRLTGIELTGAAGRAWPAAIVTSVVRDGRLTVELVAQPIPPDESVTGLGARWIGRFEKGSRRFTFSDVELP
ncbi:MAG: hypothetical protein HYY16_09840 [Planctomycetes bacterium]|nr:hypothetical protein [Planctomycetota bacterium]